MPEVGKRLLSWCPSELVEEEVKYRIENVGEFEWILDMNILAEYKNLSEVSLRMLYGDVGEDNARFIEKLDEIGIYDDVVNRVSDGIWDDSNFFQFHWESMLEYLTEIMNEKNSYGDWHVDVSGFGWRGESGEKDIQAQIGADLLREILPDTDCRFCIYEYGENGLAINNFHHDAPMGKEWYYITPREYASVGDVVQVEHIGAGTEVKAKVLEKTGRSDYRVKIISSDSDEYEVGEIFELSEEEFE